MPTLNEQMQQVSSTTGLDPAYLAILAQATNPNWAGYSALDPSLQAIYGQAPTTPTPPQNPVAPSFSTGAEAAPSTQVVTVPQAPASPVHPHIGVTQSGAPLTPQYVDSSKGYVPPPVTPGLQVDPGGNGTATFTPNTTTSPLPPNGEAPPPTNNAFSGTIFDLANVPQIPGIDLGEMPLNRGGWAPEFTGNYFANTENVRNRMNEIWDTTPFPTAEAAQMNLGNVPQPQAQSVNPFDQLSFLLSGQGFDPATMSKLRAGASDAIAQQARAQRGSARLAAEQAGVQGGGGQRAIEAQVNRRQGDATTEALNAIDIENAVRGLENMRMGAGMELQRGTTNAQSANAMALANAQNMLQAMTQNVSNMQQANMNNFAGQQDRRMQQASDQSNYMANAGNAYNTATLAKAATADETNTANAINWRLNQANLNRGRDIFNTQTGENRWGTGVNGLLSLAGMQNPQAYSAGGNTLTGGVAPNSLIGVTASNIGNSILNNQLNRQYGA